MPVCVVLVVVGVVVLLYLDTIVVPVAVFSVVYVIVVCVFRRRIFCLDSGVAAIELISAYCA